MSAPDAIAPPPAEEHGRQAPYSTEAEQAVLGAMIIDPDAALRGAETLDDWMFYREAHRRLFRSLIAIARRQEAIDPITLKNAIEQRGDLEAVGGVDYLSYLLDVVPTAANFDYHAGIVRDKALLRRLIEVGTSIVQDAFDGKRRATDICETAESKIFALAEQRSLAEGGLRDAKQLVFDTIEQIESLHGAGQTVTGVPSGFRDLDERTAGFQPSDLIIVAARPSVGKTAFCLNIAQHFAIEKGGRVGVFSLEMSKRSLMQRMLTSEARIDAHRMRTGSMRDSDYKQMASAAGLLSRAPIAIDDTPSLTPLDLRARCRRYAADRKDLSLVIVDYLQLMREPEYKSNRVQEVSAISRALKALAKELNVPVIALSQLSRASELRGGKERRPQLSDLRESGAIEQDADVVLFLYRPEMYAKPEERDELAGQAEVIIGKQRNGPTGTVKLYFHAQYTRFDNYTARDDQDSRGEQTEMHAPTTFDLQRPTRTRRDIDE